LHLVPRSAGGRASDARVAALGASAGAGAGAAASATPKTATKASAMHKAAPKGLGSKGFRFDKLSPADKVPWHDHAEAAKRAVSSDVEPQAGAGGGGPAEPRPKPLPAMMGHAKPRSLDADDIAALKSDQLGADLGISEEFVDWFFQNHNGIRGHAGVETTYSRMIAEFECGGKAVFHACLDGLENWKVKKHVRALRRLCPVCQKIDGRTAEYVLERHLTVSDAPWTVVQADWSGPYPPDKYGKAYILQFRCTNILFSELFAYETQTAENTARMALTIVARYGLFRSFMTDQGTPFTAEVIRLLMEMLTIKDVFSVPHRPQAMGSTERMHGELTRYMRGIIADKKCLAVWSDMLPLVQRAINSDDIATGVPSQSLLYGTQGRLPTNPLEWLRPVQDKADVTLPVYLEQVLAGQTSIRETHAAMLKERIERCIEQSPPPDKCFRYDVGMRVLTNLPSAQRGVNAPNKFSVQWRGPYVVLGKLPGESYRIGNIVPEAEKSLDVHIEHLRPFLESASINRYYDPANVADMDTTEFALENILDWVVKPMVRKGNKYTVSTAFYLNDRWECSKPLGVPAYDVPLQMVRFRRCR
jgi:hypothetical protein